MLSHVTLGVRDIAAAQAFYDELLATLGYLRLYSVEGGVGYGRRGDAGASFWLVLPLDGRPPHPGNGVHVALLAPDRPAVDAFHASALAAGGSDAGAPGLRPHYHPNYYGAYVRDPDGNKIQAVCHDPPPG